MKAYEILPAGMTGSAIKGGGGVKVPKPYEIVPEAGVAVQGLGGWMKGASSMAWGVPAPGVFSRQAIGLPYEPEGTLPTHGGAAVPRTRKMYEIVPSSMIGSDLGGSAKVPKMPKVYEILPTNHVQNSRPSTTSDELPTVSEAPSISHSYIDVGPATPEHGWQLAHFEMPPPPGLSAQGLRGPKGTAVPMAKGSVYSISDSVIDGLSGSYSQHAMPPPWDPYWLPRHQRI